jgi:hypothetical protein
MVGQSVKVYAGGRGMAGRFCPLKSKIAKMLHLLLGVLTIDFRALKLYSLKVIRHLTS